VLACAQGRPNTAVVAELGCDRDTVAKWRHGSPPTGWKAWSTRRARARRTIGDDVVEVRLTSPSNAAISVWPLADPLLDWEVLT
jgi:hypothetical protein